MPVPRLFPRLLIRFGALALGLVALSACAPLPPGPDASLSGAALGFQPVEETKVDLMSKAGLALLEESVNPVYLLGEGDVLRVDVFGRHELGGKFVVGPDGVITLPLMGSVAVASLTREQAQVRIDDRLRDYFTQPYVTVGVEEYTSNYITVLGRVQSAGRQRFANPPTLAEVLANAGAMPILDKQATLSRCAIMRGRDKLIWVDLKALLNGDLAYNLRMKKGDMVFIPDSSETAVYVLGEVPKPGSYRLTPRMTVLDALAQAGGPSADAAPKKIGLYRAASRQSQLLDYARLLGAERTGNFALEDGDVLFVPTSGLADFGYFLRQISPAISVLTFGMTLDNYVKQNQAP